jgi:hypothetical protein
VKDGAASAGVEYYLQAIESDQAAEPQPNVCLTMLKRQPDVMITAAINSTLASSTLRASSWRVSAPHLPCTASRTLAIV